MKSTLMILSLILVFGCTNNIGSKEIQKTMAINDEIASRYMCKLTADVIEDKDKRLEISIDGMRTSDDLMLGKIFIDYYRSLTISKLKFDRYVLKESGNEVYTISDEQADLLNAKVDFYQNVVDHVMTDRKSLYELLDENLKSKMSFEVLDTEFSKLSLSNLVFSGFIYTDTLMSFGFDNSRNRLLIVINPLSEKDEILGIEIK